MGYVCMVANNEQYLVKHIKDFNNDMLFCLTVVNQEPPAHCNKQTLDVIIRDGHKK
jgi:hypothetical protein